LLAAFSTEEFYHSVSNALWWYGQMKYQSSTRQANVVLKELQKTFFLSSFLPFFLSSFLPFFLSSFLPFFLSSFFA
jgi:hypothetical protein